MEHAKVIWEFLMEKIKNECGVAGLMGNLYAESGLKPDILQHTYKKKLGFDDSSYTHAVDSNSYNNFVRDAAGYGLAQWTYWSRKKALLSYARENGKSIGDLTMQLEFLCRELEQSYRGVLQKLKTAKTVKEASNEVLLNFEKPADQSDKVKERRADYGMNYYRQFAGKN